MSTAPSASSRFAATPELVALALPDLQKRDLAVLIRVCKLWFACAAPHLWRDIPGTEVMVRLFMDEDHPFYHPAYGRMAPPMEIGIELMRDARADQKTRFEFYSPFVRTLHAYGAEREPLLVDGEEHWRLRTHYHFIGFAAAGERPLLLPNCHTVIVDRRNHDDLTFGELRDLLSWIISPSCVRLQLSGSFRPGGRAAQIGVSETFQLCDALSAVWPEGCPLQVLEVHGVRGLELPGMRAWLPTATSLRELGLRPSDFFHDPELFAAIGTLPHLRHLRLQFWGLIDSFRVDLSLRLQAPEGSFPSLSKLTLGNPNWSHVARLGILRVPQLLVNLASISINAADSEASELADLVREGMVHAPRLTSFELVRSDHEDMTLADLAPFMDRGMVELRLGSVYFASAEEFSRFIARSPRWESSLTCFEMLEQDVSADDLLRLTGLPYLELLTISLDLRGDLPEEFEAPRAANERRLLLRSHFLFSGADTAWAQELAK
ncbi:hypothetical protein FRC08_006560 [Ceratobasidium sp. 394]|nr:hypothetical protein FRC08_006560 [Ceratobasidium sp. 394]